MPSPSPSSSTERRLLAVFAHPDDETFGLGATLLRYARQGVGTYLICATNGEMGDVPPELLRGFASVAELRLYELACAAEKLGIRRVITLGYRDSGMMGSAANDHPNSLWQADRTALVGQIVRVIREVRPQVVVTFDPYGGYGHPDHIAIHQATVSAFHEAGEGDRYPEQIAQGLAPYRPAKLYYMLIPRSMIRLAVILTRLIGRDPRRMGRNRDLDMQAILDAALPIHTRIDVRAAYDASLEAYACHASQQGHGLGLPLPRVVVRQILGWQTFHRAWPEVSNGRTLERDLFAGL